MNLSTLSKFVLFGALFVSLPAVAKEKRSTGTTTAQRIVKASVILPERMCTGSIVRSEHEVLTAAHCVNEGANSVTVRLPDGRETEASILHLDRDADLALLHLDQPANVKPLPLADHLPKRGSSLLFVGRTDRKTKTQLAKVERLGRCPSLPDLPNAVFTSLDARPGDSGAPLVDSQGRVAAIVHGGARCEIAVPTAGLSAVRVAPKQREKEPVPDVEHDTDGWTFQPTDKGFRFRWSWHWRSD